MRHFITLAEQPGLLSEAAAWFHEKWGIPEEAYRESMADSLRENAVVPRWYLCLEDDRIVGGLGVIDNDFHDRRDLTPNVCAVYTEPDRRGLGIAGTLLALVCADMKSKGVDTLYLITDHTSFYERYGWSFLCMVNDEGGAHQSRLYVHKA